MLTKNRTKGLKLKEKIESFIKEYAKTDSSGKEYNSPDAYSMLGTATQLGECNDYYDPEIRYPNSDFSQGGYIMLKKVEKIHFDIMQEIVEIQKSTIKCSSCSEEVLAYKFCSQCGKELVYE